MDINKLDFIKGYEHAHSTVKVYTPFDVYKDFTEIALMEILEGFDVLDFRQPFTGENYLEITGSIEQELFGSQKTATDEVFRPRLILRRISCYEEVCKNWFGRIMIDQNYTDENGRVSEISWVSVARMNTGAEEWRAQVVLSKKRYNSSVFFGEGPTKDAAIEALYRKRKEISQWK